MFLEPRTIADTLGRIDQGLYVLPPVQREFVWPDRKIIALFDSLMRGYPVGTFLFWHVSDATIAGHAFYPTRITDVQAYNAQIRRLLGID